MNEVTFTIYKALKTLSEMVLESETHIFKDCRDLTELTPVCYGCQYHSYCTSRLELKKQLEFLERMAGV